MYSETVTANKTTDPIFSSFGGAKVFQFQNTTGSIDGALETSLDGGTNWIAAKDKNGTAIEFSFSAAGYARFEILSAAGDRHRIVYSNSSSPNLIAKCHIASNI